MDRPSKQNLILALLFALACFGLTVPVAQAKLEAQVNFSRLTHPRNQIGFTHGAIFAQRNARFRTQILQRAQMLHPTIWRGTAQQWSFNPRAASRMGARPVYTLSDEWLTIQPNPRPRCNYKFWSKSLPFLNMAHWRSWVAAQAKKMARAHPRGEIWVDVWNEPDFPKFWPTRPNPRCYSNKIVDRTGSRYLNTFLQAERVLRKTLGSRVRIMGPSGAFNVFDGTQKMVRFCAKRGCRLDIIAWHLCGGTQRSVNRINYFTSKLHRLLRWDRTWRKATRGPRTGIWMTEYLPVENYLMPGAYVSYWYALERSNVDGGALAEWNEKGSLLNSLLGANAAPRSLWWNARAYAAGRAGRVAASTTDGSYSILASRKGSQGLPQIMVGNNNAPQRAINIRLSGLGHIHRARRIIAKVYLLPQLNPRRKATMPRLPRPRQSAPIRVRGGAATIKVMPPRGSVLLIDLAGN